MRIQANSLEAGMLANIFGILCEIEEVAMPRYDTIGARLVTIRLSYPTKLNDQGFSHEPVSVDIPEDAIVLVHRNNKR